MNDTVIIGGEVSLFSSIDGDGNIVTACDGEEGTIMQYDSHSEYVGSYEVTPSAEEQIIPIANMIASQNIRINPIPQNYGLITWNGSVLTVS